MVVMCSVAVTLGGFECWTSRFINARVGVGKPVSTSCCSNAVTHPDVEPSSNGFLWVHLDALDRIFIIR